MLIFIKIGAENIELPCLTLLNSVIECWMHYTSEENMGDLTSITSVLD